MRRGRPLTSQIAFGGQLPYKGSLVRPVVRFDHNLFEYNVDFYEPRITNNEPRLFSWTQVRLRRDRLMIVLRPSATRHKFWLCTGFAAGRPTEHPPGRPLRYRIQAMGKRRIQIIKNTRPRMGQFYEPRVTRGDVVILNLLPRSGI